MRNYPSPPPSPACLGIVTKDEDVCIFCYWDEWEILKTNWLSSDSYHNIPVVRRDLVLAGQMYCSWRCSGQLWNLFTVNREEWHYRQAPRPRGFISAIHCFKNIQKQYLMTSCIRIGWDCIMTFLLFSYFILDIEV